MMTEKSNLHLPACLLAAGVAVLAIGLCLPANLRAQGTDTPSQTTNGVAAPHPNQQPEMAGDVAHPRGPQRQLKRLTRMLNLTQDQQRQMLPILKNRRQRMKEIRKNTALSPQQRREQVRSLRMHTRQKMEAVMTDAQKKQFESMRRQKR